MRGMGERSAVCSPELFVQQRVCSAIGPVHVSGVVTSISDRHSLPSLT